MSKQRRDYTKIPFIGLSLHKQDQYHIKHNITQTLPLKDNTVDIIQSEDVMIIEVMQEVRKSPAFNGGNFSPVLDNPKNHFNKWVAKNLV